MNKSFISLIFLLLFNSTIFSQSLYFGINPGIIIRDGSINYNIKTRNGLSTLKSFQAQSSVNGLTISGFLKYNFSKSSISIFSGLSYSKFSGMYNYEFETILSPSITTNYEDKQEAGSDYLSFKIGMAWEIFDYYVKPYLTYYLLYNGYESFTMKLINNHGVIIAPDGSSSFETFEITSVNTPRIGLGFGLGLTTNILSSFDAFVELNSAILSISKSQLQYEINVGVLYKLL